MMKNKYKKKCSKCGEFKELSEFHRKKRNNDGHTADCKICRKEYSMKYYINNKETLNKRTKKHYDENKEYMLEYHKEYRKSNHTELSEKSKKYYKNNKEKIKLYREVYSELNKEREIEYCKKYYKKNKKRIDKSANDYNNEHIEERREYRAKYRKENRKKLNKYNKKYRKSNPHIVAWRSILRGVLKRMGLGKTGHTIDMLGYSADDLKIHMESLFTEGMSWYNHGEWHIDHKIPVSKFKKDTPASVVNSLDNLQPLWSYDNLSKLAKIYEEFKSMYIYKKYCIK